MKRAKKYFKVQYDSDNNNGFVVTHQENSSVCHFRESRKGLHYMDLNQHTEHALVTTVKDNKEKYTPRDVGMSTLVRKLQDVMAYSARYLIIAVCSHIKNCPVTAVDAKLAEKKYGPSIAGVRGKIVYWNEPAFEVEQIPTLAADIFYVNSI